MPAPAWVALLVFLLFLVIRPRWWKSGIGVLALWYLAGSTGFALGGWIHILPFLSLAMFVKGVRNRRRGRASALLSQHEPMAVQEAASLVCSICNETVAEDAAACPACGAQFSAGNDSGGADGEEVMDSDDAAETGAVDSKGEIAEEQDISSPTSLAGIQQSVLHVLEEQFGGVGLQFDEEDAVTVRCGTALVVIRTIEDPAVVQVFSPFLATAGMTAELAEAVNDLNRTMPIPGRAFWEGNTLILAADVGCDPFSPAVFAGIVSMVGAAADQLDDRFQQQFGGSLPSSDYTDGHTSPS